jgi:hypothetical protein
MELMVLSAVSAVAIGMYVLALWFGGHRTVSTISQASNLAIALVVIAIGLASAAGLRLSTDLLTHPERIFLAIGRLIKYV